MFNYSVIIPFAIIFGFFIPPVADTSTLEGMLLQAAFWWTYSPLLEITFPYFWSIYVHLDIPNEYFITQLSFMKYSVINK